MIIRQDLVDILRDSVRLEAPELEHDKAYKYTDKQLEGIIHLKITEMNPEYTLRSLPKELTPFVMILSRKEIYWRMATSSAPFYPISAEGASLQKNVRFDHYIQLIKLADDEYNRLMNEGGNALIEVFDAFIDKNYYTTRNKLMSSTPEAYVEVDKATEDMIEVSWEIPNLKLTKVKEINLYVSTEKIVDEYNYNEISEEAVLVMRFTDPRVRKFRISELEALTDYFIAIEVIEINENKSINEINCMTPIKIEEIEKDEIPMIPVEPIPEEEETEGDE